MLKRLLIAFVAVTFFGGTAFSQFVIVNSPSNIEGGYNFSTGFGADLTSDIWTGDIAFVDDGTDTTTDGCETLINGADLMGKIAFIDRGGCEFGLKALQAEQEGAIAAVILNNQPGAGVIDLGAGANGGDVTIPVVMLSFEDGQLIRGELANGAVNMTIGNVIFDNNIRITDITTLKPLYGVVPASQVEALGYNFTPGAAVQNLGQANATGVSLSVDVQHQPVPGGSGISVYSASVDVDDIEPDSANLVVMDSYTPDAGSGVYTITYTVDGDGTDEAIYDNTNHGNFAIVDNAYCKCTWDFTNDRPLATSGITIAGGGNIEILSGFRIPAGEGLILDSIVFRMSLNSPLTPGDLEPNSVSANIYEWIDADGDLNATTEELSIVSFNQVSTAGITESPAWFSVPVNTFPDFDPVGVEIDGPDKTYFIGTRYEGAETVFFGFDSNADNQLAIDRDTLIGSTADFPYLQVTAFADILPDITNAGLFTEFGLATATGLLLRDGVTDSANEEDIVTEFSVFPNPATNLVNVEIELEELQSEVTYNVVDAKGSLVFTAQREMAGLTDKASFNVSALPAGQYFLVVKTENGAQSKAFTVQR
jgi:hypothetical protein